MVIAIPYEWDSMYANPTYGTSYDAYSMLRFITGKLEANTRTAAVTTDMPLEPDKPIDVGIKKFCDKCKICAEECPSGAISFSDRPDKDVRGYRRWGIDQEKCYTIWNSVATSHSRGCRVCLAVCPYSRKRNWVHNIVRQVDPRDPTGLFAPAMLAMQKKFFDYPGAQEYLPPPDGSNKTYLDPPKWLRTDEWFDM